MQLSSRDLRSGVYCGQITDATGPFWGTKVKGVFCPAEKLV
jgi:hypothetical protein